METVIFLTAYFVIIFSILGYGLFFAKIINSDFFELNYGYLGLLGIIFLIFISYATNLFFPHNYIHNTILHILGIFFFIFFHIKLKKNSSRDFKILVFVVLLFLVAIFLSKNNEDFPYYHFPYTWIQIQHKLQFGQGLFQSGYRHHSSLLFFNSLLYLPKIEYYLFSSSNLIIFSLVNLILFENILNKKKIEKFDFIFILNLFSLIFLVTVFNRLADFGTDKAGQVIVFLLVIKSLEIINNKNEFKEIKSEFQIFIILLLLLVTLKVYFLIYAPLIILLLIHFKYKLQFIKIAFLSRITLFGILLFLLFSIINIANNGCIIYPIASTCFFDVFPWSVGEEAIQSQRNWFEIWAKGGAGPGFRIENPELYIQKLNWFKHWIEYYFFTKVSDLIGILFIICTIFLILFLKKKRSTIETDYERKYKIIYLFLFSIFLYWFFEHPQLRYGGYCIIALIVFIPLSLRLELSNLSFNMKQYGSYFLIIISLSIFVGKNFIRINKEFKRNDQYQYKNFPYYYVDPRLLQRVIDEPKGLKRTIIYGYEIFSNN